MPKIYLSTLKMMPSRLGIDPVIFKNRFSILSQEKQESSKKDILIEINDEDKNWLDTLCMNISYPKCNQCQQPICGSGSKLSRCQCETNELRDECQKEYRLLYKEIVRTEHALEELQNEPFRQLRNAYGFCTGIFGGIYLILSNLIPLALLSTGAIIATAGLPALLLGIYVYLRGYREEQQINADYQAELMAMKVNLMHMHRELVTKRNLIALIQTLHPHPINYLMKNAPQTKRKRSKEKRSSWGNPISHFTITSSATLSLLTVLILKFSIIATVLGGPVTWTLAALLALGVGTYFGYNRFKHLVAKKKFDKKIAILDARKSDIHHSTNELALIKSFKLIPGFVRHKNLNLEIEQDLLLALVVPPSDIESDLKNKQILCSTASIHEQLAIKLNENTKDDNPDTEDTISNKFALLFNDGINAYLKKPRDETGHLHWMSRHFDANRGIVRANAYQTLFTKSPSLLEKQTIAYSLFASQDGEMLQKQVGKSLGYVSLEAARDDLRTSLKSEIKTPEQLRILNESVIGPIVKNANHKKSYDSGAYDDAVASLRSLRNRKCG